jgi:hypothetical protein
VPPVKTGGTFDGHAADIVAALKNAKAPMAPGALMKAVGANNLAALRYWILPLINAKAVVATGVTASRRFQLPGTPARRDL